MRKQPTHISITPAESKSLIFLLPHKTGKFGTPKKMTPKSQAKIKHPFLY